MNTYSLKRSEILKSRKKISQLLQEGVRYHSKYVSLYFMPSEKMAFAVLVKKKAGKPHRRIKIKRWIREIYRIKKHMFSVSCSIVILAHTACSDATYTNLDETVTALLNKMQGHLT